MKAPGLTKAMRAVELEDGIANAGPATIKEMLRRGLLMCQDGIWGKTARFYSALAAPAMTRKEYDTLQSIERGGTKCAFSINALTFNRLRNFDWITESIDEDESEVPQIVLTPSGSKALNDMRAAEGSDLWKP
jgi:hypothetical protein